MDETKLPTDPFSKRLRELTDNPEALHTTSTIELQDFYGNHEAWILTTFRHDSQTTAFVMRMATHESDRLRVMLPPGVMSALDRQSESLTSKSRRRGARQAVATKIAAGVPVGNARALAQARKKRKRSRTED